nr:MAG TPA: hypothetical protein [Caudoviricetes sp.]
MPLKLCFSIVFTVTSHHTIPSQRIRNPQYRVVRYLSAGYQPLCTEFISD